jgi:outer membrane receptor for monomeric catechols
MLHSAYLIRPIGRLSVNVLFCFVAFGALAPVRAQTNSAPTPGGAAGDRPVQLGQYVVTGDIPADEIVLPTNVPVDSVYGEDRNIIDTPRSVSVVNKVWMDDRAVANAMDFSQFAPGVYSPSLYGVPATPTIRGDTGAIFFNGQQGLYGSNNVPPSFNGVESLDIVKGPGSAVYGPPNNGAGGYVDLVTKQPYFDGQHVTTSATIGDWTSGRTYSNPEFTIDDSGPISNELAYRVSYLSQYGEGYALGSVNQTQDVYAALTFRPDSKVSFSWFGQVYSDLFDENTGVNRVTQAYLDSGLYLAGPVLPNTATGVPITHASTASYTLANGSKITIPTGATTLVLLNPALASFTHLEPFQTLVNPNDSDRAKRLLTQLDTKIQTGADSELENVTYFDSAPSRKWELYGYDSYVPIYQTFDDRAQYDASFSIFGIKSKIITGLDFRYLREESYSTANEPYLIYDLTQPGTSYVLPSYLSTGSFGGWQIPGNPAYSVQPGKSTQDLKIVDVSAFYQQEFTFGPQWSALLGVREDRIDGNSASPALAGNPNVGLAGEPYGAFFYTRASVTDPGYFSSLIFKPSDTSSVYFTFDRENASDGGGLGGATAYSSSPVASPPKTVFTNSLSETSKLYEVGYKQSLIGNKLYSAVDVFEQVHTTPQVAPAPNVKIVSKGIEGDLVYQASRQFTLNANATYEDLTSYASSFNQNTASFLDGYPATLIVDGQPGLGVGAPTTGNGAVYNYSSPTGRVRTPGIPAVLVNFFASYAFDSHFSAGLGPQIIGRRPAATYGPLYIPGKYELDGFVSYREQRWDVRLNVKNLTNQLIFDPINASNSGNDVILPRPGAAASLTIRYRL